MSVITFSGNVDITLFKNSSHMLSDDNISYYFLPYIVEVKEGIDGFKLHHVEDNNLNWLDISVSMIHREKPPLGLVPKWVRERERIKEITSAIDRYADAGKPIPEEWIKELESIQNN